MSDLLSTHEGTDHEPLLDTLLREAVPEIKLALGDLIDKENQRAIPDRYVKILPESTLVVTLRPDAATAVQPIAAELERELTDSCMRHGSLYDRAYRVRLRVAAAPGAPLFRVASRRGDEPEPEPFRPPPPEPTPRPAIEAAPVPAPPIPTGPSAAAVEAGAANETVIAARPPAPTPEAEPTRVSAPVAPALPSIDPDATRLDGVAPPPREEAEPQPQSGRFDAERFALVIESEEGEERERFPIPGPLTTVGRQTENPELRADVAITDAPHVSRRQLALVWAPRGGDVGFTVYNVGLNPLHVNGKEIAGANRGKGDLRLEELVTDHTEWVSPETPMRIGEHGPVLRIEDLRPDADADGRGEEPVVEDEAPPEVEIDPDATRFG
jgi:hypothetical protein